MAASSEFMELIFSPSFRSQVSSGSLSNIAVWPTSILQIVARCRVHKYLEVVLRATRSLIYSFT
jgi:hypothetical protein